MIQDIALKPCPFCGGSPKFVRTNIFIPPAERVKGTDYGFVKCFKCGANNNHSTPNGHLRKDTAIRLWNRRTPND